MDLAQPARSLIPGVTMPVLAALAHRGGPVSSSQVHRAAAVGTESGIRRALNRLAESGLVLTHTLGGYTAYQLNADHVLYSSVRALLDASSELQRRLGDEIASWAVPPVTAAVYGSAARGDGGPDSDIDLLLIRPDIVDPDSQPWVAQTQRLREQVGKWTGNLLQLVDRSLGEVSEIVSSNAPIVHEWRRDAITTAGQDVRSLLEPQT